MNFLLLLLVPWVGGRAISMMTKWAKERATKLPDGIAVANSTHRRIDQRRARGNKNWRAKFVFNCVASSRQLFGTQWSYKYSTANSFWRHSHLYKTSDVVISILCLSLVSTEMQISHAGNTFGRYPAAQLGTVKIQNLEVIVVIAQMYLLLQIPLCAVCTHQCRGRRCRNVPKMCVCMCVSRAN